MTLLKQAMGASSSSYLIAYCVALGQERPGSRGKHSGDLAKQLPGSRGTCDSSRVRAVAVVSWGT
jgi:hypothetical protein